MKVTTCEACKGLGEVTECVECNACKGVGTVFDMTDWVDTYTDAPTDYDGFGTKTVGTGLGKTRRGEVRKVLTPPEHTNWQRMRYGSGMCLALDAKQYEQFSTGYDPIIVKG